MSVSRFGMIGGSSPFEMLAMLCQMVLLLTLVVLEEFGKGRWRCKLICDMTYKWQRQLTLGNFLRGIAFLRSA